MAFPLNNHPENNVEALRKIEACDFMAHGIQKAGPICGGDAASLPTRIVLRQHHGDLVTHLQVFDRDGHHRGFVHGHYFSSQDQSKAEEDFYSRTRDH